MPGNQKSCLMPDIADLIFSLVSIQGMLQETVDIIAGVSLVAAKMRNDVLRQIAKGPVSLNLRK